MHCCVFIYDFLFTIQIRIPDPGSRPCQIYSKIIFNFYREKIFFPPCFCRFTMRQCYIINNQQKTSILCDNFLTVRDKRKLPRVISSWKSERKLWLRFQLNQSIFLFSSLKSVTINFGFLNLFLDIWIRNTDPDPGPNWMRIQPDPDPKHWFAIYVTLTNLCAEDEKSFTNYFYFFIPCCTGYWLR